MLRAAEYFAKSLRVIRNDTALLSKACISPYYYSSEITSVFIDI